MSRSSNHTATTEEHRLHDFYDFIEADSPLKVLGGYKIVERPLPLRIVNIVGFVLLSLLMLFNGVTCVATIAIVFEKKTLMENKTLMAQAIFNLSMFLGATGVVIVRYLTANEMRKAVCLLKEGIYFYYEELDGEYFNIKRKRLDQLMVIIQLSKRLFMSCSFVYITVFPALKFFFADEDMSSATVNPYLPLPLIVPFDTSASINFWLMFIANGVSLICIYSSYVGNAQFYVGCAFQLAAEIEILNFSLENIEKRALSVLKKRYNSYKHQPHGLFDNPLYRETLLTCLKKNIEHHQAVLRLKNAVRGYIEGTNTVGMLLFSIMMADILVLLEDISSNMVLSATLITTLFGYFPMCYLGEMITNVSSRTFESFYSTPWPLCDAEFKKIAKISLTNTLHPIIFRAKGLRLTVSFKTFGDLLSSGYKVLNIMR